MATKIFLCRHGQDEDNEAQLLNGHRDRPLTELGLKQAEQAAERICSKHIDVCYCSPLQRAKVTAEKVCEPLGLHPIIMDDLIERDFGVLTGRPYTDIDQYSNGHLLHTEKVKYFLQADGSETFPQCYARAQECLLKIDTMCKGKSVLLVCHGDIGKMLMAARRKMTWEEALKAPYIANTDCILL